MKVLFRLIGALTLFILISMLFAGNCWADTERLVDWQHANELTGLAAANQCDFGDRKVRIGILDTGVDPNDEVFDGVSWGVGGTFLNDEYDSKPVNKETMVFDPNDFHGTGIAAIIAAGIPNKNLELVVLRIPESELGNIAWANAISYAADIGLDIVTCSVATLTERGFGKQQLMEDAKTREAISRLIANGGIFVCAAGNSQMDIVANNMSPQCYEETVTVGGVNKNGSFSYFNNTGDKIQLYAPASSIVITDRNGGTRIGNGTSYAAPIIAAQFGILKLIHPDWSKQDLESALLDRRVNYVPNILRDVAGFLPEEYCERLYSDGGDVAEIVKSERDAIAAQWAGELSMMITKMKIADRVEEIHKDVSLASQRRYETIILISGIAIFAGCCGWLAVRRKNEQARASHVATYW